MWFAVLFGSLFAAVASGFYSPLCAEGGLPVCATNGRAYLYFENECRLNAYIYKRLFLGKPLPVKTDLENCLQNCHEIVCPAVFRPACAQQVPDGLMRTVPNACLVNQLICATKRHWKIIGYGHCPSAPKPKSYVRPPYSYTSTTPERYQKSDAAEISPSYAAQEYSPKSAPAYSPSDQSPSYVAPYDALSPYEGQRGKSYSEPVPVHAYDSTADPILNEVQPPVQYPYPATASALSAYAASDPVPAPCSSSATANTHAHATYAVSDQSTNYVAPAPNASAPYAAPDPVPAPASYEEQPPSKCSYSAPAPAPAPAPVHAPTTYAAPDQSPAIYSAPVGSPSYAAPAPATYAAAHPLPVPAPYEAQSQAPCSYTSPALVQSQRYATPASSSTPYVVANAEPSSYVYTASSPYAVPSSYLTAALSKASTAISSAYSRPATGILQNSIANIYSRLPGSLNLAELLKRLNWRFSAFVYQPRYIHIIYNTD